MSQEQEKGPSRRLERRIEKADLRLRDALYAQRTWGWADKPSEEVAREKQIAKLEQRLESLLARAGKGSQRN